MITSEFLLASIVVILIPGTGVIYTVTTGLKLGWKASIVAALGCTLGIVPHIMASILGLSALLNMSAQVFAFIKFVGSAYLLYLAWTMWREAGSLELSETDAETRTSKIILKAIAINLLNPKLTVFFFAFLPLFVSENAAKPTWEMILLSSIFMALTFLVFVLYGILASSVRELLLNSTRLVKRIQQTFAVILAGFAVKLALSDQ